MSKATYAPGTEYLITLSNGVQLATGGFKDAFSLLSFIQDIWSGEKQGCLTLWEPNKKVTWSRIEAYQSLLNPDQIAAILDIRGTTLVVKLGA